MATIRTKDIMKSLPLVASVLGDKYGVNVIVGGDQACTDGKTIYLPRLPLDTDSTLLSLAKGFVDHEAAHIRYTDFVALRAANFTPFEKHLWNIIEDWRVENQLTCIFPGCGPHFRWIIEYHFGADTETAEAGDDPASQIDDKARSADFAPPSAASCWAERHEIRSLTAGVNPAYSRIIGADDFVNSLRGGG